VSETTTVEVKRDTWSRLNSRREPGDAMDDVIVAALDDSQVTEAAHATHE